MTYCLNPKKAHENRTTPAALVDKGSSKASVVVEEQVTCQFCKYLLEGALLGDCRVTSWIGSGTFGDVYKAQQLPPLNRRVALKVMAVEHVADGRAAELFAREVQAIAALDHPNILPVLRVGTIAEGRPYLVMKFAAHGSLQKFCSSPLPPYSVLPTTLQKSQAHEQKPIPAHAQVLELPPDKVDKHDSNDDTNKAEIVAPSITAQDTLSTETEITNVPTLSELDDADSTLTLPEQDESHTS